MLTFSKMFLADKSAIITPDSAPDTSLTIICVSYPNPSLKALLSILIGGVPYPGWNEWKVVYELKVNKYRMSQPEHVSDEL